MQVKVVLAKASVGWPFPHPKRRRCGDRGAARVWRVKKVMEKLPHLGEVSQHCLVTVWQFWSLGLVGGQLRFVLQKVLLVRLEWAFMGFLPLLPPPNTTNYRLIINDCKPEGFEHLYVWTSTLELWTQVFFKFCRVFPIDFATSTLLEKVLVQITTQPVPKDGKPGSPQNRLHATSASCSNVVVGWSPFPSVPWRQCFFLFKS